MTKKQLYPFVAIFIVLFIVLGIFLLYSQTRESKPKPTARPMPTPQEVKKGEIGYQEPTHTVEIGSEKVSGGVFDKVEGGQIFFEKNGSETTLPLTVDEVVLACTNQQLKTAKELDYNEISKIHVMKPAEIGGKIPENEYVVVFAEYVEGVLRAHTVAIAAPSCMGLE